MIRRKDSLGYVDFLRDFGKFEVLRPRRIDPDRS